ncbi:hypothetical protein [Actinoplanes sp. NPDC051859]|uniref:hypothetical protein n=1 Tax=Actinoplanes sp. NPDC051859 TaxID=3363909 RepID=UPI0037AE5426
MSTHTFELLNGTVTAAATIRRSGTVIYRLAGRATGSVAFLPDVLDDQPIPDRLIIRCGDGDHLFAARLRDLPNFGEATLIGGGDGIDLAQPNWFQQLWFQPHPGATPAYRSAAAIAYARVVIQALAAHYRTLNRAPLMLAAARRTADRRLARTFHTQIRPANRMFTEDRAALSAMWATADGLQQLSPLRLLPSSPARDCGATISADPDVYVTSDDDGDWLTCPACDQPTVTITAGAALGGLLAAHADHACPRIGSPSRAVLIPHTDPA